MSVARKFCRDRILIIGAGPSGLGIAEALREKGFLNIDVLERRNRPGGQSLTKTITYEGKEYSYDLGSGQPFGSSKLFKLIKHYGLSCGRAFANMKPIRIQNLSQSGKVYADFIKYPKLGHPLSLGLLKDISFLMLILWKYRKIVNKTNFLGVASSPSLTVPFFEFLDQHNWHCLKNDLEQLAMMIASLGYPENNEDRTLASILNFIFRCLKHPMRYINGQFCPLTLGYQELWKRSAATFNVHYSQSITAIHRHEFRVKVVSADTTFEADYLIIACPLNKLPVTSLSEKELYFSNHYRSNPSVRASMILSGVPIQNLLMFSDLIKRIKDTNNEPHVLIPEARISADKSIVTVLVNYEEGEKVDVERLKLNTIKVLQQHFPKVKVEKWLEIGYWREYNTSFTKKAMTEGIYEDVENQQGQERTYYVGESISGSSHGACVDYGYKLVDEHFKLG